jgi:hypothetical protein
MNGKTNGPRLTLELSCLGCEHERSESYRAQGDSGQKVFCTHAAVNGEKYVGDTRWDTPSWCPERTPDIVRIEELVAHRGRR